RQLLRSFYVESHLHSSRIENFYMLKRLHDLLRDLTQVLINFYSIHPPTHFDKFFGKMTFSLSNFYYIILFIYIRMIQYLFYMLFRSNKILSVLWVFLVHYNTLLFYEIRIIIAQALINNNMMNDC